METITNWENSNCIPPSRNPELNFNNFGGNIIVDRDLLNQKDVAEVTDMIALEGQKRNQDQQGEDPEFN